MARAYLPWIFTGGTRTTSRAEAINALIKRYVSSKNEISDLIEFIIDFERKSIFNNFKIEKDVVAQYENHPIIVELRGKIFDSVFNKHFHEFSLSHNYLIKLLRTEEGKSVYEARSILAKNPNKSREVHIINNNYACSCDTFVREGLICRHIFTLSDKTLEKFVINQRWLPPQSQDDTLKSDSYCFDTELASKYSPKIIPVNAILKASVG